jgi:predicted methyltransferase
MPSLINPDHRIEDRQELVCASCDGDFLELALRQQALIELFDNRVKSRRFIIWNTSGGGLNALTRSILHRHGRTDVRGRATPNAAQSRESSR